MGKSKIGTLRGYFVTSVYREDKTVEWLKGEVVDYIIKGDTNIAYCSKMDASIAPRYHHLVIRTEYLKEMIIDWERVK
jgi:hypothetical protein